MLERVARDHGDVAHFHVGPRQSVVLNHPRDVEQILVKHRKKTRRDEITREMSTILGNGLLTSEGAHWKRQRKQMAPSFTPRHIASYARTFVDSTRARLPAPGRMDIVELNAGITLDIIIRTMFGAEPNGEANEVGPLLDQMMRNFRTENRTLWTFIPKWVPGPHRRAQESGRLKLDELVYRLIRLGHERDDDGDDLLSRLLATRDESGAQMTDAELRDELLTIFLAGHETTALTLSYALWLLAEHPEVLAEVHAEIDALEASDDPPNARALPVLDSVIKETLRLYPAAWLVARESTEEIKLESATIDKGTMILASQWVLQRDPRFWIGATRFRPIRWRNGETDGLPKMAYFPFGGGERTCIGNHFAHMEAVLVLATFLKERSVRVLPGFQPTIVPYVTLRPENGLELEVIARPQKAIRAA